MPGLTPSDLNDASFVDAAELASDSTASYITYNVTSTTTGTNTVVLNISAGTLLSGGIQLSRDNPVAVNDIVTLAGTTGGADGTYTVATLVNDTTFTTVEALVNSTGGTATFKYQAGATNVGYNYRNQPLYNKTTVQAALTEQAIGYLLDNPPIRSHTMTPTYVGDLISIKLYVDTGTSLNVKRVDYSYSAGIVSQYVVTVYGLDGTTVVGQKTVVPSYSVDKISSLPSTRNV